MAGRRLTVSVRRGLRELRSLAQVEADSGWLGPGWEGEHFRKLRRDVLRAMEWIDTLPNP